MEKSKKLRRYVAAEYDKESIPSVIAPKPQFHPNGKKKVVFAHNQIVPSPTKKKSILKVKIDHESKTRLKESSKKTEQLLRKLQIGCVLQLFNL